MWSTIPAPFVPQAIQVPSSRWAALVEPLHLIFRKGTVLFFQLARNPQLVQSSEAPLVDFACLCQGEKFENASFDRDRTIAGSGCL